MRREADIERRFRRIVQAAGGYAFKFVSPGRRDVPDRLVALPGQPLFLVEMKKPGGIVRKGQRRLHAALGDIGHKVWVIGDDDALALFERWVKGERVSYS